MDLPKGFLNNMEQQIGETDLFIQALQEKAPVSIRLNPFKKNGGYYTYKKVPWHPQGRYLEQRPVFTLDPSFHAGAYYVQEASSMFLHEMLRQQVDLSQPLKVLDLCASPGGKSTLLASAISPDSMLAANEVIKKRIEPLRQNLMKWGTANYILSNHDPTDFSKLNQFFDVVVVDAPCSGEGLFRKDPKAINGWSLEQVAHCSVRQKRILKEAVESVADGGLLIYSTCTYNQQENDQNLKWLLETGLFESIKLQIEEGWGIAETQYGYQFYPHKTRGEGFFTGAVRKTAGGAKPKFANRPIKGLKPISKKELPIFYNWVEQPSEWAFFQKNNNEVVVVPKYLLACFSQLANALKRRSMGLVIGVLKNKKFIPSHALALSNMCKKDLPSIELEKEQALMYLKKEAFPLVTEKKGWHLIRFNGNNLGWVKMLGHRFNNYLPTDWRIRMEIGYRSKVGGKDMNT